MKATGNSVEVCEKFENFKSTESWKFIQLDFIE